MTLAARLGSRRLRCGLVLWSGAAVARLMVMAGFGAHGSSCEAWAEDLESRIEAVVLGLRCLYYQACVAGLRCAGLVEGGLWMQTLASWPVAVPAKRESIPGLGFGARCVVSGPWPGCGSMAEAGEK